MPGRSTPRSLPQSRMTASFIYSTTIMFLEPPPSMPPRPMTFSRGLSSMTLARAGLSVLSAAATYWLATRWASAWERRWARTAWPREVVRLVLICWPWGLWPPRPLPERPGLRPWPWPFLLFGPGVLLGGWFGLGLLLIIDSFLGIF